MQYIVGRGFSPNRRRSSRARKEWNNKAFFDPDLSELQRAGVTVAFRYANELKRDYTRISQCARHTLRLWILDICEEAEHYARHPVWMEDE